MDLNIHLVMFFVMLLLYVYYILQNLHGRNAVLCSSNFCHKTSLQFTWRILLHIYVHLCASYIMVASIGMAHVSQGARSLRDSIEEVHGLGTSDALLEAASGAWVIILRIAVSWQLPDLCETCVSGWLNDTHTYNIYLARFKIGGRGLK